MASAATNLDFRAFLSRVQQARGTDPRHITIAGKNLVDGALRIRRGGDGIYGDAPARPGTRPAEAIGAWLDELARESESGSFHREAEAREALAAAAEEVDAAVKDTPAAARLQSALYADAATALGNRSTQTNFWPWVITAALGGALVGVLLTQRNRRR